MEPEMLVETPDLQTFTYTKVINSETGMEDYHGSILFSIKHWRKTWRPNWSDA